VKRTAKEDWFGPRLKEAREYSGLTQDQVAEFVGVAVQTVKDWENARKTPKLERIPRLAEVLGVSPGRLFPDGENPAPDRVEDTLPPEASVEARLARIERQLRRVLEDLQELKGR
jgi:transcriptional regulator with XRE-family HTH domain